LAVVTVPVMVKSVKLVAEERDKAPVPLIMKVEPSGFKVPA